LYFLPKYAAVNNTNIETVVMKRQKCITFSVNVEIKDVLLFFSFVSYPVSQISFLWRRAILWQIFVASNNETYWGLHVLWPLFTFDFNHTWIYL